MTIYALWLKGLLLSKSVTIKNILIRNDLTGAKNYNL